MYSPADLPSSSRAAPAKKRIWSTIGGTSSDMVRANGLPVFSHSAATSSSARASMASAMRMRARLRSEGVVRLHPAKAAAALRTARSTSAGPETGASANGRPVLGSTTGAVGPSAACTRSPSMKFQSFRNDPASSPPTSASQPSSASVAATGPDWRGRTEASGARTSAAAVPGTGSQTDRTIDKVFSIILPV